VGFSQLNQAHSRKERKAKKLDRHATAKGSGLFVFSITLSRRWQEKKRQFCFSFKDRLDLVLSIRIALSPVTLLSRLLVWIRGAPGNHWPASERADCSQSDDLLNY
jgi:hypothetical protein